MIYWNPHYQHLNLILNILKHSYTSISLSAQWSYSITRDSVVLLFWTIDHCLERWIVINENLNVKVFLKGILSTIGSSCRLTGMESICKLIKNGEKYIICADARNILSDNGGHTVDSTVKRIMKKLMTDFIAQNYSWLGAKGKEVFSSLGLCEIVFAAARKNPSLIGPATDADIELAIKNWLRHAKARCSKHIYIQENSQSLV